MSFLDRFLRREKVVPLGQLCYDVAYYVLPHYAEVGVSRLSDLCGGASQSVGPFLYLIACQMEKVNPLEEDATKLLWQSGVFADGTPYWLLKYPIPALVDFSDVPVESLTSGTNKYVLAPHFSVIVSPPSCMSLYFVLGQAPTGGGTTLRSISIDREPFQNNNLGPGPEPNADAFLEAVHNRIQE